MRLKTVRGDAKYKWFVPDVLKRSKPRARSLKEELTTALFAMKVIQPWTQGCEQNKLRENYYHVKQQFISIYKWVRGRETAIPPLQRSNHIPEFSVCYSYRLDSPLRDRLSSLCPFRPGSRLITIVQFFVFFLFPDLKVTKKRLTWSSEGASAAVIELRSWNTTMCQRPAVIWSD